MKKYYAFISILLHSFIIVAQNKATPLTLTEFNKLTSDKTKKILVYFHADWCLICAKMKPTMQKIDSLYGSRIDILYIDTDQSNEITEALDINALPVFMIYKDGIRKWGHIGILAEKDLVEILEQYLLPAAHQR